MIQLPATAGLTTTRLTTTARAAGSAAALLALTAGVAETVRHTSGVGPGAHRLLLTATVVAVLAAMSAGVTAGIRRLITTATTAVLADQARISETLQQLTAEVARLRSLLRDRDELIAEQTRAVAELVTAAQGLVDAETSAAVQRINLRLLNGGRPGHGGR
ncbi:hypothetical protein ACFHW1_04860 [Micromonospora sp. LOL_014]|uniref:hypothetical protein n=1 Tax=Micromonospora sp. LOL_014 TaxID=3345415 RepID=UPI003A856C8C